MAIVMTRDVRGQSFAQRVKQRREELELTQPQAAERAGLGVDTWRTVERGYKARRGTDPETGAHQAERITVRKIARVLSWQPEQALQWAGYDDEVPPELPAGPDPREQLTEIVNDITVEQARALLHFLQTMTDHVPPVLPPSRGHRGVKLRPGSGTVPDPRNNESSDL